jgi:hypothetical protein
MTYINFSSSFCDFFFFWFDILDMFNPYRLLNKILKSLAFRVYLFSYKIFKKFLRWGFIPLLPGDVVIEKYPYRKYNCICLVYRSNLRYFELVRIKYIPKFTNNVSNNTLTTIKTRNEDLINDRFWDTREYSVDGRHENLISKKILRNPDISLERKIELLWDIYSINYKDYKALLTL